MISQSYLLFQNPSLTSSPSFLNSSLPLLQFSALTPSLRSHLQLKFKFGSASVMALDLKLSNGGYTMQTLNEQQLSRFVEVGNKVADAAGQVIREYFWSKFDILDKDDLSPVTIADQTAEESMVSIISENFPSHAIYGEERGWRCKEKSADYVWILDPIDGTKSFITGKPLFGPIIALLQNGRPILGIIDQPVLRERWIGMSGQRTTLNGQVVSSRTCSNLSQAY